MNIYLILPNKSVILSRAGEEAMRRYKPIFTHGFEQHPEVGNHKNNEA